MASNVNKTIFLNHSKDGILSCTEVTDGLNDGRERAQADINTARDIFCFKIELLFWYLGQKTSSWILIYKKLGHMGGFVFQIHSVTDTETELEFLSG